ncbi:hypothetical protein HK102_008835 [Quaeritorhiza haematococci]|nr:hypothetical protein HK102_008835 [Quaeritorhiza haematococci]
MSVTPAPRPRSVDFVAGLTSCKRKHSEDCLDVTDPKCPVQVSLRVRKGEDGLERFVQVLDEQSVEIVPPASSTRQLQSGDKKFKFTTVFGEEATQENLFGGTAKKAVDDLISGKHSKCLLMSYGPSGSGKTYSLVGTPDHPGLIHRTAVEFIHKLHETKGDDGRWKVTISIAELYGKEDFSDLLNDRSKVKLYLSKIDDDFKLLDLKPVQVTNEEEVEELIATACKARSQGATLMNETSSRSHMFVDINIEVDDEEKVFRIVDLAGVERTNKSGVKGDMFTGTNQINNALMTLRRCFNLRLQGNNAHIPYADSKLTQHLKAYLEGGKVVRKRCASLLLLRRIR